MEDLKNLREKIDAAVKKGNEICASWGSHDFGAWSREYDSELIQETFNLDYEKLDCEKDNLANKKNYSFYVHKELATRICRDCGATQTRTISDDTKEQREIAKRKVILDLDKPRIHPDAAKEKTWLL